MTSKRATCPNCGRDLGNKRTDLENEYRTTLNCPKCHVKLAILYGKGNPRVQIIK